MAGLDVSRRPISGLCVPLGAGCHSLPAAAAAPVPFAADNLGFHHGRPVAALVIFRCCLQWKTFQADRTPLFDRIIAAMGSQVELHQENNDCLAYWLTNTVTLLYLMQKNIKPASGGGYAQRLRQQGQQVTRWAAAVGAVCWRRGGGETWHGPWVLGAGEPRLSPAPNAVHCRGLFGSSKGSFTSFFTRTGYGGSPGGEASIHGGAAGGFRQVPPPGARCVCWVCWVCCVCCVCWVCWVLEGGEGLVLGGRVWRLAAAVPHSQL